MGSGDDVGDLAGGEWRKTWETWQLSNGDDVGHLAAVEWRRSWRLGDWRVETTLESQRLGSGEDNGNVAGGGVETKQET